MNNAETAGLKSAAGVYDPNPSPQQDPTMPYPVGGCQCFGCSEARSAIQNRPIVKTFAASARESEKQAFELQERAVRNRRAAELLAKHPEFDDLLELLSIVPVKFIKS